MNRPGRDAGLILSARAIRTFAYGYLSVLLGLYLEQIGFVPWQVGAILTTTLAGSAVLTLMLREGGAPES